LLALLAGAGSDAGASLEAGADSTRRICAQPYPITFEQTIQNAYKSAFAVFSGIVLSQTIETATIRVTSVWKGKLGAKVAMATGTRDNRDGTFTVVGEAFSFRTGEHYLIFAYGTSAESLSTDVCTPSGKLTNSNRTIAVLNQIVKRGEVSH
jgi:hypothetical protein